MHDLKSNISVVPALAPDAFVAGVMYGGTIDLTGFSSAVVAVQFGAVPGVALCKLQESNTGFGDWADIEPERLIGEFVNGVPDTVQTVGLTDIGNLTKAYIRPVLTITGSGANCGIFVVKGNPKSAPTDTDTSIYIS